MGYKLTTKHQGSKSSGYKYDYSRPLITIWERFAHYFAVIAADGLYKRDVFSESDHHWKVKDRH